MPRVTSRIVGRGFGTAGQKARRAQYLAKLGLGSRNYPRKKGSYGSGPKYVVGGVKRGSRGNSKAVRLSGPPGSGQVFVDQAEVELCSVMDIYWVAGRQTAAAGNYISVFVNNIVAPFNATFTPTLNTATYSFASNGQLVQGEAVTDHGLGLTQIQALYGTYRVVKYRLEITASPGATADAFRLVAFPSGAEEIPSGLAANTNLRVAETQPYALSKTVSSGAVEGPGNNNMLVISGTPYKDLGLTREVYMGSGYQTPTSTAPAANISDFVGIYMQQLNGANNGTTSTMQLKLFQTVVCGDNVALIN